MRRAMESPETSRHLATASCLYNNPISPRSPTLYNYYEDHDENNINIKGNIMSLENNNNNKSSFKGPNNSNNNKGSSSIRVQQAANLLKEIELLKAEHEQNSLESEDSNNMNMMNDYSWKEESINLELFENLSSFPSLEEDEEHRFLESPEEFPENNSLSLYYPMSEDARTHQLETLSQIQNTSTGETGENSSFEEIAAAFPDSFDKLTAEFESILKSLPSEFIDYDVEGIANIADSNFSFANDLFSIENEDLEMENVISGAGEETVADEDASSSYTGEDQDQESQGSPASSVQSNDDNENSAEEQEQCFSSFNMEDFDIEMMEEGDIIEIVEDGDEDDSSSDYNPNEDEENDNNNDNSSEDEVDSRAEKILDALLVGNVKIAESYVPVAMASIKKTLTAAAEGEEPKKRGRGRKPIGKLSPETILAQIKKPEKRGRKPGGKSVKGSVKDKKMRKKEQNKTAATRYRQKKKMETMVIHEFEKDLADENDKVRKTKEDLAKEIKMVKQLMREIFKAAKTKNRSSCRF